MKLWKRSLSALLAAVLALACAACAKPQQPQPSPSPSPAAASPSPAPQEPQGPVAIGLLVSGGDPTLEEIQSAFADRLAEWGLGEGVWTLSVRTGDAAQLKTDGEALVREGAGLLVGVGLPAAQAAAAAAKEAGVPTLFAGAGDLAQALGVQYPDSPEGGVTGAQGATAEDSALALARQAAPALKTLGILTGEDTSLCAASIERLRQLCAQQGLDVKTATLGTDPAAAATALAAEVQAVITPDGGVPSAAAGPVAKALLAAKIPWVTGGQGPVRAGALGSVGADAAAIGRQAADQAVELIAGRPVSQVPVASLEEKYILLNQATLDALPIQLSQETLDAADYISAAVQ